MTLPYKIFFSPAMWLFMNIYFLSLHPHPKPKMTLLCYLTPPLTHYFSLHPSLTMPHRPNQSSLIPLPVPLLLPRFPSIPFHPHPSLTYPHLLHPSSHTFPLNPPTLSWLPIHRPFANPAAQHNPLPASKITKLIIPLCLLLPIPPPARLAPVTQSLGMCLTLISLHLIVFLSIIFLNWLNPAPMRRHDITLNGSQL
jgi:hypothetical protein